MQKAAGKLSTNTTMTLLIAFLLMAHMGIASPFAYLAVALLWVIRIFINN